MIVMWEDMLKNEEPWWTASLKRMLEEAREYHKEASDAFYRLKKKLYEQNKREEVQDEIELVDSFVIYFPAGGAPVHDLFNFLENHVL